jgi:hypothetical protein
MINIDLTQREFLATILDDTNLDNKVQGRYTVNIPELQPHMPHDDKGIIVKNHVHKWRVTPSKYGEYGQYFPLQPFTQVMVKFFENDPNTGYIDRVVSDFEENTDVLAQDCVDAKSALKDRDNQYIICKTPKFHNIIYFNEETDKEPNKFVIVFNRDEESEYTDRTAQKDRKRRTVVYVDENGIHLWTHDNNRVRIRMDENRQIGGNKTEYVKNYRTQHIGKDNDLTVHKNDRLHVKENRHHWIEGEQITNIDKDEYAHNAGNQTHLIDKDVLRIIEQNLSEKITQNRETKISGNDTTNIDGNQDVKITGNETSNTTGNTNKKVSGSLTVEVSGNINITSNSTINVYATKVNVDSPRIDLNSQMASATSASSAKTTKEVEYPKSTPTPKTPESYEEPEYDMEDPKDYEDKANHRYNSSWTKDGFKHAEMAKARTRVRDLGPNETNDYELEDEYPTNEDNKDQRERKQVVGEKCDDVTDSYNIKYRETLSGGEYYNGPSSQN